MLRRLRETWRRVREAAPSNAVARRYLLEYAAVRAWTTLIGCFPIEMNLRTARFMGRCWWALFKRHRDRALENLRPALGDRYDEAALRRIARGAFEHFAQLYLVELAMTPRLITEWSWARYIELGDLGPTLQELFKQRGAILVTAHFGNYEIVGYTVAKLGIPISAVMRPLDNPLLTEMVLSSRARGGLDLLFKKGVTETADALVASGGALSFIADQDAGRKGVFAEFFGRAASWYKSIALLAMHRRVPIIVGGAARVARGFHYRIEVERIIQPEEWDGQADPLLWITQTYAAALEAIIRRHPEQYLWMHRRWKTRPRHETSAP
jgi:KDO2-lipid IV(A) lauroyltransferase